MTSSKLLVVPSFLAMLVSSGLANAQADAARTLEERVIGRTVAESGPPAWPDRPTAPKGAPNILVIMTDDVGFGSPSTFGGPVPTPVMDSLVRNGARYNRFHTSALCSPTRAALLTGRDPHQVSMGRVTNFPTGYDGYTTVIPKSSAMISEILRQAGYGTAAIGKWHLIPEWEESPTGPFDRWPTGQGFEYFYGFKGGSADQFAPDLVENTRTVAPPRDDPTYILERDLADHAIDWITTQHQVAPGKPFFLYYASGTAHAPIQAPKEWLEKFRGAFDQGWDAVRAETFKRQKRLGVIPASTVLTPRPAMFPAWSSLPPERRKVYARLMEAYAAQVAYADHEVGRVVEALRRTGQLDNTLIVYIQGDNGSSAEGGAQGLFQQESFINQYDEGFTYLQAHVEDLGGPNAHNHYPAPWAWAMDAPFQYYKQVASHFGGIRNGMVISWPSRIARPNAVRQQFSYVSDIVPTILDAIGLPMPGSIGGFPQKPMDGVSLLPSFKDAAAPVGHKTQVFEMMQNLGIYHDGWWAGTRPIAKASDITKAQKTDLSARVWELYKVDQDFSQSRDLASKYPEKLKEMVELFFSEAARKQILPIHGIGQGAEGRPRVNAGRDTFTFYPGLTRLPETVAPRLIGHGYIIVAEVEVSDVPASGVLVTHGGRFGGYAFYLDRGRPTFYYNATARQTYAIRATGSVPRGRHTISAQFVPDRSEPGTGGTMTIFVNGTPVANGRIERTHKTWISSSEGFDVGQDSLTPINDDYTVTGSRFSGRLEKVTIEIKD
ncbi:MAG: arylsulfatase [Novosphingobium sp.]|nr:arylsulfatase [Novosphingobium sp.]